MQRHSLMIEPKSARIISDEQFLDLSLNYYGYEECEPLHTAGPSRREHFLFQYILSGKGNLMSVNDRGKYNDFTLKKDQGFLLWPGQDNLYTADEKDPWVRAWVCFNGQKAREYMIQAGLSWNNPVYTGKNNEDQEKMKDELLAIVRSTDNGLPLVNVGHLYLFIGYLINSSLSQRSATGGSIRNFYINESMRFIERHYQQDINVADIAASCGIDRSYLSKIFFRRFDITPHEFLLRYRVNKSCELLKVTDLSIGEISAMVGYPNQFSFSRIFKNVLGKSPREWRNEHRISFNEQIQVAMSN